MDSAAYQLLSPHVGNSTNPKSPSTCKQASKQHVSHTAQDCESERQTTQVRIAQVACCTQFSTAESPCGVDCPTELQTHKFGAHRLQSCSPGLGSHPKSADEFKQTSFVDAKLSSHDLSNKSSHRCELHMYNSSATQFLDVCAPLHD